MLNKYRNIAKSLSRILTLCGSNIESEIEKMLRELEAFGTDEHLGLSIFRKIEWAHAIDIDLDAIVEVPANTETF